MYSYDHPLGQSARTPPPTLLFLSSLVKEQISPRRDKKKNLVTPSAPSVPGSRSLHPDNHSVAAVDEDVLLEPGFQVNTQSEDFLTFFECSSAAWKADKAKPFSEDAFSSELYLSRGRCPSTNIWILRQRSRQVPQIAPWSWAHVSRQR